MRVLSLFDPTSELDSNRSPDKVQFMDIAHESGLQAELAWRTQRFEPG